MTYPPSFHLDDLAVGQTFTSASHTVDADQIKAYARQFDPQPFHLDEAAAEASYFRGLAASGWHTASITMRLLVEGGAPIANGVIGAGGEIAWPRPTRRSWWCGGAGRPRRERGGRDGRLRPLPDAGAGRACPERFGEVNPFPLEVITAKT